MNNTKAFKALLQNPELPFNFIKGFLAAMKEKKTPYIRGKR